MGFPYVQLQGTASLQCGHSAEGLPCKNLATTDTETMRKREKSAAWPLRPSQATGPRSVLLPMEL